MYFEWKVIYNNISGYAIVTNYRSLNNTHLARLKKNWRHR